MMRPLLIASACALVGCAFAAGHRAPQPFCSSGYLVRPGEFAGTVLIGFRNGVQKRLPLIVSDSVCLRHKPAPFVPDVPVLHVPIDTNPSHV